MPIIITIHIADSSSTCLVSHTRVIIHAEGPDIAPYMSRAIGTIHAKQRTGIATSAATRMRRSCRTIASTVVTTGPLLPDDAVRRPVEAGEMRVRVRERELDLAGRASGAARHFRLGKLEAVRKVDACPA